MFGDQIIESKLEAIMAMSALLQGPIEVGNMILAREGVIEILLAMTEGGDTIHVVCIPLIIFVVLYKYKRLLLK